MPSTWRPWRSSSRAGGRAEGPSLRLEAAAESEEEMVVRVVRQEERKHDRVIAGLRGQVQHHGEEEDDERRARREQQIPAVIAEELPGLRHLPDERVARGVVVLPEDEVREAEILERVPRIEALEGDRELGEDNNADRKRKRLNSSHAN